MLHRLVSLFLSRRVPTLAGLAALAAALWLFGASEPTLARDGSIEVDVELVLAVDISYSMDPEEQALQRQGYVEALKSPVILDAIAKGVNGKIAITYVEWAGSGNQDVIVPWMVIDGMESAQEFTARLMAKPIRRLYRTSISGALDFSVQLFEANNYMGLKRVIDVSGDGSNNQGRPVTQARDDALARGITINGLPLMLNRANFGYPEVDHLDQYYTDCVIGGPAAFTIPIRERDQFIDATRTKILLEIAFSPPVGLPANVIPAQFSPGDLLKTQAKPAANCMFGERSWQQRWGN